VNGRHHSQRDFNPGDVLNNNNNNNNKNSVASELFQPSDRHLLAKLVPCFAAEGVAWLARSIPATVFSIF
jgi:hypothetical protein